MHTLFHIVCRSLNPLALGLAATAPAADSGRARPLNPLTPEEERVILHRGTEPPFSGATEKPKIAGTYLCRRCNAPLYWSKDQFPSHCGWPSFDDEIPGAVRRTPDPDGRRIEIRCAHCGAHLGHVFAGEGFTAKNLRHCVNSVSLRFVPVVIRAGTKVERALFAGGCFWGMQYRFAGQPGVLWTCVGFCGGHTPKPTYEQVCRGDTGHAETLEVFYDARKTSFERLARFFFEIHDPTQVDGQGPDRGSQYRSAVFYLSEAQKRIARDLVARLRARGLAVVTQILPAGVFWPAAEKHQNYYRKTGGAPYCHAYTPRF